MPPDDGLCIRSAGSIHEYKGWPVTLAASGLSERQLRSHVSRHNCAKAVLFKARQVTRIGSQLNDQMAWLWRRTYCNNSAAFAALGKCRARDATYICGLSRQ